MLSCFELYLNLSFDMDLLENLANQRINGNDGRWNGYQESKEDDPQSAVTHSSLRRAPCQTARLQDLSCYPYHTCARVRVNKVKKRPAVRPLFEKNKHSTP